MSNNNNNYYIPEGEEFHVGFDYENFVKDKGWTKRTLMSLEDYPFNEEGAVLDIEGYRVKSLDKNDIESLGFVNSKLYDNIFLLQDKIRILPHLDPSTIGISFNQGISHILLFYVPDEEKIPAGVNLFVGNIKNKSELKKLLVQTNILKK